MFLWVNGSVWRENKLPFFTESNEIQTNLLIHIDHTCYQYHHHPHYYYYYYYYYYYEELKRRHLRRTAASSQSSSSSSSFHQMIYLMHVNNHWHHHLLQVWHGNVVPGTRAACNASYVVVSGVLWSFAVFSAEKNRQLTRHQGQLWALGVWSGMAWPGCQPALPGPVIPAHS